MSNQSDQMFGDGIESLKTKGAAFKDSVIDVKDHTVEGATKLLARIGRTIKAHPFAAVGIAIGVGYLAMRLIRR